MRRAVVLLALALFACSRETPQPPPAPKPQPVATQDGGRLVRRLESAVQTLNYVLQTTADERQVLALLYDPLIELDRDLSPIPATAARWEVLDQGRTYVLHLDPRATFSDGTPVRASDVVFTLAKILDDDSMQFASWFSTLDREATKAVNDRTVRVVFKEARVGQLLSFNIGVMPEHVYAKENFQRTSKVVGNGPYVLERRGRDGSLLLKRREDYWREKPAIGSVLFRPIVDGAVAWRAMQKGDVDVSRVDNDLWFRVKDDPAVTAKIEFHNVYQLGYNCILWNLDDPLLNDVRVRQALAMSFDRQAVIDRLYHGQARPVTGPFTPDQWANDPHVEPVEHNLAGASALLASAGWRDANGDGRVEREGKPFTLTLLIVARNEPSRLLSQILQESLAKIGVTLEINALDEAAFWELVMKRSYQAAYMSWVNEPDPDPFSLFHSTQLPPEGLNFAGYRNPEADTLMEEARGEFDRERRADLYHRLHDILARDQPYLWTVQVAEKWAVNRRVQNVQEAPGVGLFLWYPGSRAWWLKQ